ncbi:MAG: Fic family protein [Treponema sp.]|nr:Fic family protein [Treponema sp.]
MKKYIYQYPGYPDFTWDKKRILNLLTQTAALQGRILGKMQQFGFGTQQETMLNALTEEILKSNEIEGEILNSEQVRSSLAKKLKIEQAIGKVASVRIEGIVDSMYDAVKNFKESVTKTRLCGWQASLFPSGYSGMNKINTGKYRSGEMQIVSNRYGNDIVYYQAPSPKDISLQMKNFLTWFNKDNNENPHLKAAIAHLWFVIIHPFDDGNGRLARIITEMLLARAENTSLRFYSMSAQIQKEKKDYYRVLEFTTAGQKNLDITEWLVWFFSCLNRSMEASEEIAGNVLKKAMFWQKNVKSITNTTQQDIINRLFDGFEGNLTTGKTAKIYKISQDTAARLLKDLVEKGFMEVHGSGRSTHYVLINSWTIPG